MPLFKDALIPINLWTPSIHLCSFCLINSIANLNNKKSAFFLVYKGYRSKWGIITSTKSLRELIWYNVDFLLLLILPTC